MAKEPTRPLRVVIRMTDGRLCSRDGIVMLDAILYHAWFAKYHPEVFDTGKWMEHGNGYVGLPLRRLEGNRWAASKGIYTELGQTVEYWNKRPNFFNTGNSDYLSMEKGQISESVGLYRAYRVPCVIRTIKDCEIVFYCMGHKDRIDDLLSYMPAIGKKAAIGWGMIESWSIEEISNDYSYMHPQYGLMRPTPVEDAKLEGYPIMDYAVKPPYWKQCNARRCYVPR